MNEWNTFHINQKQITANHRIKDPPDLQTAPCPIGTQLPPRVIVALRVQRIVALLKAPFSLSPFSSLLLLLLKNNEQTKIQLNIRPTFLKPGLKKCIFQKAS